MIDQKAVIIGVIVGIALILGLGYVIPSFSGFVALIVAGILVGYLANQDLKNGAIHGALVGLFTAAVAMLILIVRTGASQKIAGLLLILALITIGSYIILGLVGGFIGSMIKKSMENGTPSPDVVKDSPDVVKEDVPEDDLKE
ncbi:MAG TPA: DUF5518 domain-containing protein [Methanobacteriaceae archaeon]|nr:DUF5518 domain-containing protein [Methanobacteriaceae archaeon]